MKMILCRECFDVQALTLHEWRSCKCGASGGRYKQDGDLAMVGGAAQLYGVSNRVFAVGKAEAWVYDESNGKIERLRTNDPQAYRG